MTGSFDQSSEYGVKWSIRVSTPASEVESPRSPRPLMTSMLYLRKTGSHNPLALHEGYTVTVMRSRSRAPEAFSSWLGRKDHPFVPCGADHPMLTFSWRI